MKTGIIFVIKNNINEKVYIGQTTSDIKTRFNQHLKNSTLKSRNYKIYNAIKKYGKSNFSIEVLEENININELNDKEIYYIQKYDSFNNGYNSTKGGDGRTINKHYDEETIIYLYTSGKSLGYIAKLYSLSSATVSRALVRLGIKTRHDGNKYESFNDEIFTKFWKNPNITIKQMAKNYNVNEKTIRRHAKRLRLGKRIKYSKQESITG